MKVSIADVTISHREVDIPDVCPKCSNDLSLPNSLIEWALQDQAYCGHLDEDGTFYSEDMVTGGDEFTVVGWNCVCGYSLATGTYSCA